MNRNKRAKSENKIVVEKDLYLGKFVNEKLVEIN